LSFKSGSDSLNAISAIAYLVFLSSLPAGIPIFLLRRMKQLKEEEFQAKYGSAYNGLKTKSKLFVVYNGLYCLRRMIFCWAVYLLADYQFI